MLVSTVQLVAAAGAPLRRLARDREHVRRRLADFEGAHRLPSEDYAAVGRRQVWPPSVPAPSASRGGKGSARVAPFQTGPVTRIAPSSAGLWHGW